MLLMSNIEQHEIVVVGAAGGSAGTNNEIRPEPTCRNIRRAVKSSRREFAWTVGHLEHLPVFVDSRHCPSAWTPWTP